MSSIMEELLSKFRITVEEYYQRLARRKDRTGSKIIGCLPMHVPEEIIHAAGVLPIILLGSDEAIDEGSKLLPPPACHLLQGNLGLALNGDVDFLDGIIFAEICDLTKMLPDMWTLHRPFPFHYNTLTAGKSGSPSSKRYLITHFTELKHAVEKFVGAEISDQALRQSIAIYNQNRELLNRLYQMRRDYPKLLRASDVAAIVMGSMLMPKEEHNQLLIQLLEQLEKSGSPSNGAIRVVLSGHLCDQPEWEVLDLAEEVGLSIVDDDVYVGRRYFTTQVNEALDPIEALAERFVQDVPCPTKFGQGDRWANYLLNLTKEAKAKGVIISMLKHCEVHAFDYPHLKDRLSEEGIPSLLLEMERSVPLEQVRTRLQAFAELLGEGGRGE